MAGNLELIGTFHLWVLSKLHSYMLFIFFFFFLLVNGVNYNLNKNAAGGVKLATFNFSFKHWHFSRFSWSLGQFTRVINIDVNFISHSFRSISTENLKQI